MTPALQRTRLRSWLKWEKTECRGFCYTKEYHREKVKITDARLCRPLYVKNAATLPKSGKHHYIKLEIDSFKVKMSRFFKAGPLLACVDLNIFIL